MQISNLKMEAIEFDQSLSQVEAIKFEQSLLQVEKIKIDFTPMLFIRRSMETAEGEW